MASPSSPLAVAATQNIGILITSLQMKQEWYGTAIFIWDPQREGLKRKRGDNWDAPKCNVTLTH